MIVANSLLIKAIISDIQSVLEVHVIFQLQQLLSKSVGKDRPYITSSEGPNSRKDNEVLTSTSVILGKVY